jgi:hypothetical protein
VVGTSRGVEEDRVAARRPLRPTFRWTTLRGPPCQWTSLSDRFPRGRLGLPSGRSAGPPSDLLPERKHYRTYKQERTPDFSDLRNKIAEVEGEKKKLRDRKNRFAAKLDES